MILATDIGNTHIEMGLFSGRRLRASWRIATGVHRTEDELMSFVRQFLAMEGQPPEVVSDVAIASVVPNVTQIFRRMCEKYLRREPLIVHHELDLGITIDYEPPQSVGADRLCNAVAAYEKFGGNCVVVDVGTATTFDVVSDGGVYLGGIIAPGLETAAISLHQRASKLPSISFEFPRVVIGKTTEQSMQSGIMLGTIMLIDGLIEKIAAELSGPPTVIATGGLSHVLAPKSRFIRHVEPHLVLEGLVKIYLRNR